MAEVARLADQVANAMETGGGPTTIGELLDRIESASGGLSEIGAMMLIGADRLKMEELCRSVRFMIGRIRTTLAGTGVLVPRPSDD